MMTVELTGRLGKKFGRSFRFDVRDAIEAVQALCSQIKEFEREFTQGFYKLIRLSDTGAVLTPIEALRLGFGKRVHTLRIVPVAEGGKGGIIGSIATVVAGAFLVGAAFLLTGGTLAAPALSLFGATITGSQLALVGGLLALSGVSAMLAPDVAGPVEPEKDRPSFMISSPQNLANQGHPVQWVFGKRVFIGSVAVSNGIHVEDFD